jgi:hypothetical protein
LPLRRDVPVHFFGLDQALSPQPDDNQPSVGFLAHEAPYGDAQAVSGLGEGEQQSSLLSSWIAPLGNFDLSENTRADLVLGGNLIGRATVLTGREITYPFPRTIVLWN